MCFLTGGVAIAFDCGVGAACPAPGAVAKILSCGTGVFRLGIAKFASKRLSWPPARPALPLAVWAMVNPARVATKISTAARPAARDTPMRYRIMPRFFGLQAGRHG